MHLRPKDRVRFQEDINCIPAGCYKFLSKEDDLLFFSVGKRILFAVSDDAEDALAKVGEGSPLTPARDFIPRYYQLLQKEEEKNCGPTLNRYSGVRTLCILDPSLPLVREFDMARKSALLS